MICCLGNNCITHTHTHIETSIEQYVLYYEYGTKKNNVKTVHESMVLCAVCMNCTHPLRMPGGGARLFHQTHTVITQARARVYAHKHNAPYIQWIQQRRDKKCVHYAHKRTHPTNQHGIARAWMDSFWCVSKFRANICVTLKARKQVLRNIYQLIVL